MPDEKAMLAQLAKFAGDVTAKMSQLTTGEPEDQLRGPFETLMRGAGQALSRKVICIGEIRLPGRLGKPDYAVHSDDLLTGYVELKAPGVGATPSRFSGHNREQWKRFQVLPNLLYCDGNDWGLYRAGEVVRSVRLTGDVAADGRRAATSKDAKALLELLTDFLAWRPIIPKSVGDLADLMAPLCRMLRDDVVDALRDQESPLVQLAQDWRQLLFPGASDEQFADAYAQTVTFALLLARSENADPLTLAGAESVLAAEHSLLSRALQVLTDPGAQAEISASLNLILRIVGEVSPDALTGPADPWLHFYEDFLAAYDPKLRKDAGAYYTPIEVVRAQVRMIDDLLTNKLGKTLGFADNDVITLDPAVGTGTYLLGVIDHALQKVQTQQGPGAVAGKATTLANGIYGFEIMVGPFAVSELRVGRALGAKGAKLPAGGTHVYLTDTLENPHAPPLELAYYLKPIADQHKRALEVKEKVPVIVCLGNPPYDRHEAADEFNKASTGGWVRWGNDGKGTGAILGDFVEPVVRAGLGVHVKNLYNLYVYFWRWALWKVFECETTAGPGVVSFISASSYLDGDAFIGMRERMRRLCDDIWILDLGGEGRGTRKSENVFAIQTPVAIAVAVCYAKPKSDAPAQVHYARLEGTRTDKLAALSTVTDLASLRWEACPVEWHAPFYPAGSGDYYSWPLLSDVFPWQHSGCEFKRTWPICHDKDTLKRRWSALLSRGSSRAGDFRETRDRKVAGSYPSLRPGGARGKPIADLPRTEPPPVIDRYAYRSFDRQWIIADNRLGDFLRPDLWRTLGQRQVFVTSLFNHPLGSGPALTACSEIPDRHHLRGSYGGKDVIPLWRDSQGREANILPGLLRLLGDVYGRAITAEDMLAYVYALLAHPDFTRIHADALERRHVRVPVTKDAALFVRARDIGCRLLWLHTYGARFVPDGQHPGHVPRGKARCVRPVPGDPAGYPEHFEYHEEAQKLQVGEGSFAPVSQEVYTFEVSGLKVVQSWLRYRMKLGAGKKSSPLDGLHPERWTGDITTELLELLWVLEATVEQYPAMAALLSDVERGACFRADELPAVPAWTRKASRGQTGIDDELFSDGGGDDT